ncbi:AAA family ATPase [Microvirga sp. M2]|uniref:AAA family ATPase n=1 Tax=Microvirga sp. M2 TaxID=3073270 RepID=UPI0039C0EAC3
MAIKDSPGAAERTRVALRHFERRKKAAIAGFHLPTEIELLAGMPFLGDDIQRDMQAFAERLMPRLHKKADHAHFAMVFHGLEQLTVSPGMDEVRALADVLSTAETSLPDGARSWRLRCQIYLAHLGDHSAGIEVARQTITAVIGLEHEPTEWEYAIPLVTSALGWLSFAASDLAFTYFGKEARMLRARRPRDLVSHYGWLLTSLIETQAVSEQAAKVKAAIEKLSEEDPVKSPAISPQAETLEANSPSCVVVFHQVGNATTSEGKKVAKELEPLTGKALPLVSTPDLVQARATLHAEFPFAIDVIDRILIDIAPRSHIVIRPTILVGAPGSGKTRLARRLLSVLNVPHDVVPCGGISDGSFAGTPRRWSTGEPSLPVALITRYRISGPGAVLDEIEKAGTSRLNGQVHDSLLAFLERETACRFHDPYVQAPCDISHVTWLMTANTLDGLSAPLRDRCRVIPFPEPGQEHLPTLSRQIILELMAEQGLDHRWVRLLDEIEYEAVTKAWPGGSLRKLRGVIEVILASRSGRH